MHYESAVDGREWDDVIHADALPDCDSCPKPDLTDLNIEAVNVWYLVHHQQERGAMGGGVGGVKMEAVKAAIDLMKESGGFMQDTHSLLQRILIVDEIYCRYENSRQKAEYEQMRAQKEAEARSRTRG